MQTKTQGTIMVGVGGIGVSRYPGDQIKTMALGSCIAVILMDPNTRCAGMVHVALPDSSINTTRATQLPGYFADTGIPALISQMTKNGCTGNGQGWIVKLAGGANVADANNTFNVGKRNAIAIKKILWQLKLIPRAEDLGKNFSRTVCVDIRSGKTTITCPGRGAWGL